MALAMAPAWRRCCRPWLCASRTAALCSPPPCRLVPAPNFVGLNYEHRPCQWDVGVVQADALGSDPAATVQALQRLEQQLPGQIEAEARWLEHWRQPHEPAVIVADVPGRARLAGRLGWPLLWHGNFGWDSIYTTSAAPCRSGLS